MTFLVGCCSFMFLLHMDMFRTLTVLGESFWVTLSLVLLLPPSSWCSATIGSHFVNLSQLIQTECAC